MNNDGGPAYPWRQPQCNEGTWMQDGWGEGMSLLDVFARDAMKVFLDKAFDTGVIDGDVIARDAYDMATRMLAEKKRREDANR